MSMKNIRLYLLTTYMILGLLGLGLIGCGAADRENKNDIYYYPKEQVAETEDLEEVQEKEIFLILSNDSVKEQLRLYRFANQMVYQYDYTLETDFLDRYGNFFSSAHFIPGKCVYVKAGEKDRTILSLQIAEGVWEYDDVKNFSVDEERGIFYIAGEKYRFDESLHIFSDDHNSRLDELTKNDILTVIGKDNQILSIIVTTGHGKLQLVNTALFEGSFLQLNTNIFSEITTNMLMEIPEGDYVLSVANDGWGGMCDVSIQRGQTTVVDLDSIKGDGPKYGNITFTVDLEDAVIRIDGERVEPSIPIRLRYGWHSLVVSSKLYEDWSKKLYVNSKDATIAIELDDGTVANLQTNQESQETKEPETETEKAENSSSQNTQNGQKTDASISADDVMQEYLSTLTEMLSSL